MRQVCRTYSTALTSLALVSFLSLTKVSNLWPWRASIRVSNDEVTWLDTPNSTTVRDERYDDSEKLKKHESTLAMARALIREATLGHNCNSSARDENDLDVPHGDIYWNPCAFRRSYLLMEKLFKIFVYQDGEPPLFHNGPCKYLFSMEGLFFTFMETNTQFRTYDPDEAQVYFLPFSITIIRTLLYDQINKDKGCFKHIIVDYIRTISHKYPFWNRNHGADHFMLSCHNWAPWVTWYVPELFHNSIRVLCNANTSERFNPKKDASFPEINLKKGEIKGLTGGLPLANRTILAFFAGQLHGKIRPILFEHWKQKDRDVQVYDKLPEGLDYDEMMKKSKFCICPSGHEVASPRVVEAIYAECIPVLISQNYIIPFSDVLKWDSFSIQVSINELPNLKKILLEIPQHRYLKMQERVKQVQHHFVINDPPKRLDVFHMILHSIWLRRLNV
ncbi:hypothetical protein K2173_018416 [Erythroxylum novogranatense]|uniref:Exostosin GT47 domain-containing protein n=1 Tax=Erythroxylum novogranatense TaxID=1862640 RepID=A0AAV8UDR2_9ROSI|nr:hypothetical protein K2173_018416 [Erythroxylum novogranatense]